MGRQTAGMVQMKEDVLPGNAGPWNFFAIMAAVCGPHSNVMEIMTVATTLMRETALARSSATGSTSFSVTVESVSLATGSVMGR